MIVEKYKFDEKEIRQFGMDSLIRYGMSKENATIIMDLLIETDKWGTHSHGVKNLYNYVKKAETKGVSFESNPEIVCDNSSITIIDAHNSLGYVPSVLAMNIACEKSKKHGIAMSVVKNSCHFGAAGCYANMAAKNGLIGMSASNVEKRMTIPGGRGNIMGQNPLAIAVPAKSIPTVFLDIATSNVAALKVITARDKGETIPDNWITDSLGMPTTDPSRYPDEGALLPMAAHKGYGIALFIEFLTSALCNSFASMDDNIVSWCFELEKPNNVSHSFIAIDPDFFFGKDVFVDRVEHIIKKIHNSPKMDAVDRLYVPGEIEWNRFDKAEKRGLILPKDVYNELKKLSEELELRLNVEVVKE